jgi:hypothetical protein
LTSNAAIFMYFPANLLKCCIKLLTLNQRVQGSSPCAPTIDIATLILIAYRRGLRACEIADLEWSPVELNRLAALHVRRVKNGTPSVHPLRGDEMRALRELLRNSRTRLSCSPLSAADPSRQTPSIGLSSVLASAPPPIWSDTPSASPWPTSGIIRGRYSHGLVIARYSTRRATPNSRRPGSRTSGGTLHRRYLPR